MKVFIAKRRRKYQKSLKISYISVEHVMLAIMDMESNNAVGRILKQYNINKNDFLKVLISSKEVVKGLKRKTQKGLMKH